MSEQKGHTAVMHAGSSCGHALIASVVATGLWYCFDDRLGSLVGRPGLGELSWTFVLPLVLAVAALLSVAGTNWSEK